MLFLYNVYLTRDSKVRDLANNIISEMVKRKMNVAGNDAWCFQ